MSPRPRTRRPRVVKPRRAPETAFIFAGGAARGAYQAGSLLYLDEKGIKPDLVIGSSVGVINACLYATGGARYTVDAWLNFRKPWSAFGFDLRRNLLLGNSLFVQDKVAETIEPMIDFQAVLDSPVDIQFVTSNFSQGHEEFLGNRNLDDADELRTVSRIGWTIPMLYPPVKFRDDFYVDGGFAWNVPVEFAAEQGAKRLFVLSCISRKLPYQHDFPNIVSVVERFYNFIWRTAGNSSLLYKRLEEGRYNGIELHIIEADHIAGLSPWDLLWITPARTERLVDQGYEDARKALENWPHLHEDTREAGR
jgi:predicted patatin/cPLA2 family phospholipase